MDWRFLKAAAKRNGAPWPRKENKTSMSDRHFPNICITCRKELYDLLIFSIYEFQPLGLEEDDSLTSIKVVVYFDSAPQREKCYAYFQKHPDLSACSMERNEVSEEEWSDRLHGSFQPVAVGHLTIEPWNPEVDQKSKEDSIYIIPGRGYGTGNHATTHMCLQFLAEQDLKDINFLDFGCGSGLLSIVAMRFGASGGVAIDIDPDAVENAKENLAINDVAQAIKLHHGSVNTINERYPQRRFPLILANLNSKIIPGLLQDGLTDLLMEGGKLVLSGIHLETVPEISSLFSSYGLREVDWKRERQWTTALLTRDP
jgi:ribosomal protein L11 methyltransferase